MEHRIQGTAMPPSKLDLQPTIVPFTPNSKLAEAAARIFAMRSGRTLEDAMAFINLHGSYPNFHGLVAIVGDEVVGMAFGTKSEPGQWWHDRVAEQLGAAHPALQDAWVGTELVVLPSWRGQGIGGRLLDVILATQPLPRALISTKVSNTHARSIYEKHGWRYLHTGCRFDPSHEPLVIMAREFGEANP